LLYRELLLATMAKNSESTITENRTSTARNHPTSFAENSGPADSTEPETILFMLDICGLIARIFLPMPAPAPTRMAQPKILLAAIVLSCLYEFN
jgi:hypothetical protein